MNENHQILKTETFGGCCGIIIFQKAPNHLMKAPRKPPESTQSFDERNYNGWVMNANHQILKTDTFGGFCGVVNFQKAPNH